MSYIGLGSDGHVRILAEVEDRLEDGTLLFHVINGAWRAGFRDGAIVGQHMNPVPASLLWEGDWPAGIIGGDYNAAIDAIEQELSSQ